MYQKIIVVGNLGQDPEMRYMPDGTAVTNFSMAVNRRWRDKNTDEQVDETTWFRVSVWGAQAEPVNEYLAKGRQVLVEGILQADKATGGPKLWTRQDGTMGASFEIRAFQVKFLSGGTDEDEVSYSKAPGTPAATDEDDIPF